MSYNLDYINECIRRNPAELVEEGERTYASRLEKAADAICENFSRSPIVLLAGPSGSGKTTTAQKLGEALGRRGVFSRAISMDNYFITVDIDTAPRDEFGEIDLESPECLDSELLDRHFEMLTAGEEIKVPTYIFSQQARSETEFTPVRLAKNEIAIFEGIHALNDKFCLRHPESFRLYISTASDVECGNGAIFDRNWFRLMRRLARDSLFRGTDVDLGLSLWDNVRRGEKKFITPFIEKANLTLDTSFIYEASVMRTKAEKVCAGVKFETENYGLLQDALDLLYSFEPLDEKYVPANSMIREFIGGGIYNY